MSRQEELAIQILQKLDGMTMAEIRKIRKRFLAENPCISKKVKRFINLVCKTAIMGERGKQTA